MKLDASDLRKAGLKVTAPRLKILDVLVEKADSHMSAEDLYRILLDSGEEIGLATVYRVLTQFETAGLVKRHHFEGNQSVFELDQGGHHDHLVCVRCGLVVEFFDETIEERQRALAREQGFTLSDHAHTLYGFCAECSKTELPKG